MIKSILFSLLLFISFTISSQNSFDEGWDEGFEAAMLDYNETIYIIPISPIVMANESDSHRAGFKRGYKRGLKKLKIVNPYFTWKEAYFGGNDCETRKKTTLTFDDGWDRGYEDAMEDNDNSIFIIPISPIVMSNQDNYRTGYRKGYKRGLKDLR